MITFEPGRIRASELFGNYWINAEPVSIRALRGTVVLLDFWDYTSAAWNRTLPYLKEWHRRYRDFDLLVIGVHTPQYNFGKNPENVEKAIRRAGIEYPVMTDNDGVIWTSYASQLWPTKFLLDKDGFIRYSHQAEGGYDRFEHALQSLLVETGYHGLLPEIMEPLRATDYPGAVCHRATPEIQLGYLRGTIGNPEGYGPESTLEYTDQGLHLIGRVYLKGKWYNERESLRFEGMPREKGQVSLGYEALEVSSVMESSRKSRCKVFAFQDGKPLSRDNAGSDISYDASGRSYIHVDGPRLFNVICNQEFGQHELQLVTGTPGLAFYSFGFATAVIPESVSTN